MFRDLGQLVSIDLDADSSHACLARGSHAAIVADAAAPPCAEASFDLLVYLDGEDEPTIKMDMNDLFGGKQS